MGHITHLRNISQQYTSMKKAMIIQAGWLKVIIFIKTWIPFTHGCFVSSLIDSGEEDFVNINLF